MSKTGNTDWARRLSGGAVCSAQNQWRESKQICTVLSPQHQHNMPRNRPSTDSEQAQSVCRRRGGEGGGSQSQILRCYRATSLHLVQCIPRQHDSGRQFICGLVVTVRQAVVTLLSDCGGVDWTAERRVYTGLFYTEMRTVYSVQSSTLD